MFRVCLIMLSLSLSGVVYPEPFSAETLVRLDRVGSPVLSPDGQWVVYSVRETDMAADKGRTDLWLTSLKDNKSRRLTSHEANDSSPVWSPNSTEVWFLSARSEQRQVWAIDISGGEARQVTQLPLDIGTFKLSPTGDMLLVSLSVYPDCRELSCTVQRDKTKSESKVTAKDYDQLFMRHWDYWLDDKQSRLFAIDLGGSDEEPEPRLISKLNADVPSRVWGGSEEYAISPDGKTVFFAARLRDANEPHSTNFDLYQTPINGDGPTVNLTKDNPALDTQPVLSPNGEWLAYRAMSRAGFESDQYQIVLLNLNNQDRRVLTETWDRSPSSIAFSADGKSIYANAQDQGHKTLWRFPVDGKPPKKLTDEGYVNSFSVAKAGLVVSMDSLAGPANLFSLSNGKREPVQLTRFNEQRLKDIEMGEYEQFSFQGANDDQVFAYVVEPVNRKPGKKYPVAFLIHGGPQGSFSNHFHYRWNPQTYAGQGFAAIMVDFHGSTGYGQDFTDSISGDWGGKPLEDLQLGLAAALEKYDFLDGTKVCALGASYGGYMINWIAGQWPDRFNCLVNHDGVFDQRSMYYTTEELWFPEWEHGGPYFASAENYEKHNPARYVENWKTPTLVIHGELDYRVPVTQGIAAFTALQRRGIKSEFLYFPDENHWVLKPHNSVYWHQRVNQWLHENF